MPVLRSFGREPHESARLQLASGETPGATRPGLHHTAWQPGSCDELREAHRELRATGLPPEGETGRSVTRSVYFRNPDGNRSGLSWDAVDNGLVAVRTLGPKSEPVDTKKPLERTV
jgi:catechol-2,3-dioxygenase